MPVISDDERQTSRMSKAESNTSERSFKKDKFKHDQYGARSLLRQRGKIKIRYHPKENLAEVLKIINKRLQGKSIIFSEKVKKSEDEIFRGMVASELKDFLF